MNTTKSSFMSAAFRKTQVDSLVDWYHKNKRQLPWRRTKDPYTIWISETMLQQTVSATVVPYFENFIQNFPTLSALANSPIDDVLEAWAGLGYYSRARNLHKAAQLLNSQKTFPRQWEGLIEYPGFGPYTSRAVASLAFGQPVGVLDGNVIRVLCRRYGIEEQWWKTSTRNQLQALSDQFALHQPSSDTNQALMELGATVCTPKSPSCTLCPWVKGCWARKNQKIAELPIKKPKRDFEIWLWQPQIFFQQSKVALCINDYAPFLKGQQIFPGKATEKKVPPKKYNFRHSITHHKIFVQLSQQTQPAPTKSSKQWLWADLNNIQKHNPSSLIKKVLAVQYKTI